MATGKQAYYVGKPNPLMMRTGLQMLGVHSQDAAIIGDRMDTDIIAGIESGLDGTGPLRRNCGEGYRELSSLPALGARWRWRYPSPGNAFGSK